MVRYLAILLVLLHFVSSQVPSTCPSCNADKAKLIGKVTCDAQGRLSAECAKGLIQMKVDGKRYDLDRVTCIGGEWFGTSCAKGLAIYLSANLPASTCPDVDYPEIKLEGSECTIKPLGIPEIYDEYFATDFKRIPISWNALGEVQEYGYQCTDQEQWERFRKAQPGSTGVIGGIYTKSDEDLSGEYNDRLLCSLNPETGKYELSYDFGPPTNTNQMECLYRKCPQFYAYNKNNGRCEPENPNICGYALVEDRSIFVNIYELLPLANRVEPREESKTFIPSNVTHIVIYPGCKADVIGIQHALVYEQYAGLWSVYSSGSYTDVFPGIDKPAKVVCSWDGSIENAPALNGATPIPYKFHGDSRGASFKIGTNATFQLQQGYFEQPEVGLAMSLTGYGYGRLSCYFIDILEYYTRKIVFDFQLKTLTITGKERTDERSIFVDSVTFHVRFIHSTNEHLDVYLNGRLVYKIDGPYWDFKRIKIEQDMVVVDICNFFVPRICEFDHVFSEKTGDCEAVVPSSDHCAAISDDSTLTDWVIADQMPVARELKTDSIRVRQGCIAYAYNDEDAWPQHMSGYQKLNYWRGRYNFPNFDYGTAVRPERGLKHLECFCDDYNKRPTFAQSTAELITVDFVENFVFTGVLNTVIPMTAVSFVNSEGDMPLVLFFGDGKLIADNRMGGCYEGFLVKADYSPVKQGDQFECRISQRNEGIEIRINGRLAMTYQYRLSNRYAVKAQIPKAITLKHYRTGVYPPAPYGLNFPTEPLLLGDYIHFNGVPLDGALNISLHGSADEPLYTLQWRKSEKKIVQTLVTKGGLKTIESSASSLTIGVEFDIVVMNKAHTIETYINGELIKFFDEHVDFFEKRFRSAKLTGQVKLFEQRRGPKKIEGVPKWKKDNGAG